MSAIVQPGGSGMDKRIAYYDYLRGFAVFTMVMQHAMLVYAPTHAEQHPLGILFLLLGTAPAAPVFMAIMGSLFMQSNKVSVKDCVKRGLSLILLGYVLNALRFPLVFMEREEALILLLEVDILQLAGLSFIVMGFLKKLSLKPLFLFALGILILLVSPVLWERAPKHAVLDLFWGTNESVSFPFFPWLYYPLLGMGLGKLQKERERPMFKFWLIAAPVCLVLGLATWSFFPAGDYYRSGFSMHMVITAFVFLWMSLWAYLSEKLKDNPLFNLFSFWSKNLTAFYFIQWILIGWGTIFLMDGELNSFFATLIGLAGLVISHLLTKIYSQYKKLRKESARKS